ncbi:PREDICTED: maestro heat-like repeat family member 5 [Galeopterus variegatus]|uniref:Maestro heat-like repeat family member 5 n=1 Tax=Galeopterus variegatus TaxID=482537 RepID=A0ABM0S3B5_GALVR|nr:PREDICTED: maestro heat-like repeat family member 5 [Galeopterus variegatus]
MDDGGVDGHMDDGGVDGHMDDGGVDGHMDDGGVNGHMDDGGVDGHMDDGGVDGHMDNGGVGVNGHMDDGGVNGHMDDGGVDGHMDDGGKTKFTFLRCAILLRWEFRKELFSKLAWGHGLGAENDVFVYMVESNFGSYHQFLMQALVYLQSPHQSLKLAAMKFIGEMLQDYFTDLCFYLKKGDVRILRKHFEILKQDQDRRCRRFYLSFSEDITELSHFVT